MYAIVNYSTDKIKFAPKTSTIMELENTNLTESVLPFGYIIEDKIYLKGFLHFPDREIGQVKENIQETTLYFSQRFEVFNQKVTDLFAIIAENENKGSFLQKLLHFKDLVGKYEGLGDFKSIYEQLDEKEAYLNELIAKNRIKNLTLKNALLSELNTLKDTSDWLNATEKLKELRNNWIRIGAVEKNESQVLETSFTTAVDLFFARRHEFYEARNELIKYKLQKYEELTLKAETMKLNIDFKNALEQLKSMTAEWKAIGLVPKKDLEPIMSRYRSATNYIFNKTKENKQVKPASYVNAGTGIDKFKAMLEYASKICADLPSRGDEEIKKLQDEWRKVGFTKDIAYREIEIKFKSVCAKVLDIYFLKRICNKRFPEINKMTAKEQTKIQIGILKELITRDTEQVDNFENIFAKQEVNAQDNSYDTVFGNKLMMQKKGIMTKQHILKELEDKLSANN